MVEPLGHVDVQPGVRVLKHDLGKKLLLLGLELVVLVLNVTADALIHRVPSFDRCRLLFKLLLDFVFQFFSRNESQDLK